MKMLLPSAKRYRFFYVFVYNFSGICVFDYVEPVVYSLLLYALRWSNIA